MLYEEVLEVECRIIPHQDGDLLLRNATGTDEPGMSH